MTNVYTAIMQAADSIDAQPERFDFSSCAYPDCGSPACALGWIGFHLGYRDRDRYSQRHNNEGVLFVCEALGIPHEPGNHFKNEFYDRMQALHGGAGWFEDPHRVASLLRLYAVRYHDAVAQQVRALVRKLATGPRIPSDVDA